MAHDVGDQAAHGVELFAGEVAADHIVEVVEVQFAFDRPAVAVGMDMEVKI